MAISVALVAPVGDLEQLRCVLRELTFDSSYPTGGEPLTPAQFGLTEIVFAVFENEDGYVFRYDRTNEKLKALWVDTTVDGAALAEVANTTDLSAVVVRGAFYGF